MNTQTNEHSPPRGPPSPSTAKQQKASNPEATILPVPSYPARKITPTVEERKMIAQISNSHNLTKIEALEAKLLALTSHLQSKEDDVARLELLFSQQQQILEEQKQQLNLASQTIEKLAEQKSDLELRVEELTEHITERVECSDMETNILSDAEDSQAEMDEPFKLVSKRKTNISDEEQPRPKRTAEETKAQKKHFRFRKISNTIVQTPTSNYFSVLGEESPSNQEETPTSQTKTTVPTNTRKTSTTPPTTAKSRKPPPIVIHDKGSSWIKARKWLKDNKIDHAPASAVKDGISIQTFSPEDHKKLATFIGTEKIPAHSYPRQEEKPLQVVIRGIPVEIEESDIANELKEHKLQPKLVVRMKKRGGIPMPLVLVKVPRDQKEIFQLKTILDIRVKIETLRTRAKITQCHGCQLFGHSQSHCSAPYKCVKCAKSHHTSECKKPRNTPAKCANCGGAHPANYSLCPKRPNFTSVTPAPPPANPAWKDPAKRLFPNQNTKQASPKPTNQTAQPKETPQNENPSIFNTTNLIQTFLATFQEQMQKALVPLIQALATTTSTST